MCGIRAGAGRGAQKERKNKNSQEPLMYMSKHLSVIINQKL